jgi:hypothetical protein
MLPGSRRSVDGLRRAGAEAQPGILRLRISTSLDAAQDERVYVGGIERGENIPSTRSGQV